MGALVSRISRLFAGNSHDLSGLVQLLDRRALWQTFTPADHSHLLSGQRARLIISRVRLVAILFAILTPLWIVVDLAFLSYPAVLGQLIVARLLATASFAGLALLLPDSNRLHHAWLALGVMMAIPTLFFLVTYPALTAHDMEGFRRALATGYAFLPFVMVAGISIFPLAIIEALLVALPVLAAEFGVAFFEVEILKWHDRFGALWLLVLIAAVATLASISQLHFMAKLVERSALDPLTEQFNRRSGEEMLRHHFELSVRTGRPMAVAFLDIDRFKPINDIHGHEMGDVVIRQTGDMISARLRRADVLVRWGGEEFVVVLPESTAEEACMAVRRILHGGLGHRPEGSILTASAGVAERIADGVETYEDLVHAADLRMYMSKAVGGAHLVGPDNERDPEPLIQ